MAVSGAERPLPEGGIILCLSGCVTIRREKTALMIYFGSFPLNGIPENLRWLCFVTQPDKHRWQLWWLEFTRASFIPLVSSDFKECPEPKNCVIAG